MHLQIEKRILSRVTFVFNSADQSIIVTVFKLRW